MKPWKNKAEKFAIKIRHQVRWEIRRQFAKILPDQNKKSPQIRSA